MSKGAVSLFVAVVLAVAAVAAIDLATASRTADAKCWPNRANNGLTYHDGRVRHPATGPTGVTSHILNYSPWVELGSAVTAWSMLTKSPELRWAQIGWLEWANDERVTVVQYTPDHYVPPPPPGGSGYVTAYFPARPLGSSSEYKVLFRSGSFQFLADGISFGYGDVIWTPNEGQLSGEIKSLADQMPGGFNSSEWFSLSQIELGIGAWDYFRGAAAPVPLDPHFGQQIYDSWSQRIWDWACPQ